MHHIPSLGLWPCSQGVHFFYFTLISPTPFLTGVLPNITRNAIVNCGEMVTYDIIKEKLLDYHLLTGEALGSRQIALPVWRGLGLHRVGTTHRHHFRRSGGRHAAQHC